MNIKLFIILLLCSSLRVGYAETAEWTEGGTIDCPVTIATRDQERTRTIVFPCSAITAVSKTAQSSDLEAKQEKNTLVLRLSNHVYESNLQIWDENSTLYTLLVRSPAEGESPDDTLIIRKARQGESTWSGVGGSQSEEAGQARIINQDTDAAVSELMGQMTGGVTDPKVKWSTQTSTERGRVVPGRELPDSDDLLKITLLKVYRTPTLYGYDCLFEWRGSQPYEFKLQRWYRKGMLAITAVDQSRVSSQDPIATIRPNHAIHVYYVTDAGEGK